MNKGQFTQERAEIIDNRNDFTHVQFGEPLSFFGVTDRGVGDSKTDTSLKSPPQHVMRAASLEPPEQCAVSGRAPSP